MGAFKKLRESRGILAWVGLKFVWGKKIAEAYLVRENDGQADRGRFQSSNGERFQAD